MFMSEFSANIQFIGTHAHTRVTFVLHFYLRSIIKDQSNKVMRPEQVQTGPESQT